MMDNGQVARLLAIETMSAEERRGFLFACETIHTWSRQIHDVAPQMTGADIEIPLSLQTQNSARFAMGLADSLQRRAKLT